MFDRSFLPEAHLEFVVMTDTHYMLDSGGRAVEFESRRRQSARAEGALRRVAALGTPFVVHLGDLVQEFPESAEFARAVAEARDLLRRSGVQPRQVAGNHDVGDKPDPTMPTDWVTPDALAAYHATFGRSWDSWDEAGCHFVVLNSQIMNSALPEADEQRRWLESDLAAHAGEPTFVFLHLAPFLVDKHEPGLGHYDNIDEPARGWLLDLLRRHQVQLLFAGHTHFAFFNRIGVTRSFVVPSTSFTRPGFGEVFASCPPPERGRDDVAKLGFFLVRVHDDGARVHLVRTNGDTVPIDETSADQHVFTRVSRDLPASPLGVTLRHPLAPAAEVPIAWPSSIRQPVRNDYPLLACLELGVRHLRVPASDLDQPAQRQRLALLRDEGAQLTATWIWSDALDLPREVTRHRDILDGVELQIPGGVLPAEACLRALHHRDVPVTLSPLMPRERIHGKQHPRTRTGYRLSELAELDRQLTEDDGRADRVLCRVDPDHAPWDAMRQGLDLPPLNRIGVIDWAVDVAAPDKHDQIIRAAEAMFAAAMYQGSRLFLEPLVSLDRTMDTPDGLLDKLCNPRPLFPVVEIMNTVLFGLPEPRHAIAAPALDGAKTLVLQGPRTTHWLLLPDRQQVERVSLPTRDVRRLLPAARRVRRIHLERATGAWLDMDGDERIDLDGATLLVFDAGTETREAP